MGIQNILAALGLSGSQEAKMLMVKNTTVTRLGMHLVGLKNTNHLLIL